VIKYIIRRLLVLPIVIFFVTVVLFLMYLRLPVEQRAMIYIPSFNPHITEEEFERLMQVTIDRYGLDDPLPVQYVKWLRELIADEWGFSPTWRETVLQGIRNRGPASLELALLAMIPAILLAVLLGSLSARGYGRFPDHAVRSASFVAWAFPPFILALILLNVFYAWLGWFPPGRSSLWASDIISSEAFRSYTGLLTLDALLNGELGVFWDALRHLVLPAFTLALAVWALLTRVMRSSLLDVLHQDYVTTARAKGLPERAVVNRHARRNAILPVISTGGAATSILITSLVVVEVVFNYNGIGRWALKAILESDIPVATGFTVFTCLVVVLASLLADILYAVVDPRVRLF